MKAILVNYNFDPKWLKDYPELEVTIYDRSDDGVERNLTQYGQVFKTRNMGEVDYDKLGYLIEHYDNLPDVFLWSKTNLFKFVSEERFKEALQKNDFVPLLNLNHTTYSDNLGEVCRYRGEIYEERNDSWYVSSMDNAGRFNSWTDWANYIHLPSPAFLPFAPGGSYMLTRDRIHRYGKDHYIKMRETLPYARRPVEAGMCERSYWLMWH